MNIVERHEMKLEVTHPTGAEEWYCPTCGRRFVVQWKPSFRTIVLEPGNSSASHSGGQGGLHIRGLEAKKATNEPEELSPFFGGLEDIDFDNL